MGGAELKQEILPDIRVSQNGHFPASTQDGQMAGLWQRRVEMGTFRPAFHHDYLPLHFRGDGGFTHPGIADQVYQPLGSALRSKDFSILNHDGEASLDRGEIQKDAIVVVTESLKDIKPGSEEAQQVKSLAPKFVTAMVRSNDIRGIGQEHAGDIIRTAVELARNPDLLCQTVIRTGFGGTADQELVTRFPAYLLPALDMQKRLIQAQIDGGIDPQDVKIPDVEFFFAPHAFIYVNGHDRERVLQNAQNMQQITRQFVKEFYPQAVEHVTYRVDKPMEEGVLYPFSKISFDYLAHVVKTSDQEDVRRIVRELEKFGFTRGGELGQSMASHYGALHTVLFQDEIDIPHPDLIDKDTGHLINLTIGGRPERLFNRIRQEASEKASRNGFVEFARRKLQNGEISTDLFHAVEMWKIQIDSAEDNMRQHGADASIPSGYMPFVTLPFQGGIGDYPVYYHTNFDTPMSSDENPFIHVKNGGEDTSSEMRNMRREVGRDLRRLVEATGGVEPLQKFYRSLR